MTIPLRPQSESLSSELSGFEISNPSESILLRASKNNLNSASSQTQVDILVSGFLSQASDWKSLAAMTVGGLAYRWGKISVLNVGAIHESPLLARPLAIAIGLGSEVTAFEFTNRTLQSIVGEHVGSPLQSPNSSRSLWSWSGPGGWKEGLLTSLVTFGTLKSFGKLSQGQTLVLQHGAQDLGMVAAQRLISAAGFGPKPEGTWAEQFVHAEATQLQISAGMALGHTVTAGRISAVEQGLDLSLRSFDPSIVPSYKIVKGRTGEGTTSIWNRFLQTTLAGFTPVFPDRFQPQDPALKGLMDPIPLNDPHFPIARLVLAAGLVAIPLALRPFSKKASEKARFLRDVAVPPLLGISLLVGQGHSLDCYLPEILAGGVTAFSWIRRGVKHWRKK